MGDTVITTGVDALLDYLRGKERVALQDASKDLNVAQDTIQAWVDFLVEEKILGIEYKFTKPYIYINKDEKQQRSKLVEQTTVSLEQVKKDFEERAILKQIPAAKIPELWHSHVNEALITKKTYFIEQATRRHAVDPEQLWEEYHMDLISRC